MAIRKKMPEIELSFGHQMPSIGFGTAGSQDWGATKAAVLDAIRVGYRHLDTAFSYGSEKALGEAVNEAARDSLIKSCDELFITTKLWCTFAERDLVVSAIKMSLENLQMEYVDLYLVHFPVKLSPEARAPPFPEEYVQELDVKSVWEGMEECRRLGLAKSIGVSNFSVQKLQQTLHFATIPLVVNQVYFWCIQRRSRHCSKRSGPQHQWRREMCHWMLDAEMLHGPDKRPSR